MSKTSEKIAAMREGGQRLAGIKAELKKQVKTGVTAKEIDDLAERLIKKAGGEPSFKMVENYEWSTCVNVNEGVVHGIPKETLVFKKGDIVSVDVGMFYKGYHTDTSFSIGLKPSSKDARFLKVGKEALEAGISQAKVGNRIYDISKAIEETLKKNGATAIKALVGHGIGEKLHEEPAIPCFTSGKREESPIISEEMTLAIEVMYAQGKAGIEIGTDGWTISTQDGKISALFEETVASMASGPLLLTK